MLEIIFTAGTSSPQPFPHLFQQPAFQDTAYTISHSTSPDPPPNNPTMSAARQVFRIPQLVQSILSFMDDPQQLARCIRVSSTLFHEGWSLLWKRATTHAILHGLQATGNDNKRREAYAAAIETLVMRPTEPYLEHLRIPQLETPQPAGLEHLQRGLTPAHVVHLRNLQSLEITVSRLDWFHFLSHYIPGDQLRRLRVPLTGTSNWQLSKLLWSNSYFPALEDLAFDSTDGESIGWGWGRDISRKASLKHLSFLGYLGRMDCETFFCLSDKPGLETLLMKGFYLDEICFQYVTERHLPISSPWQHATSLSFSLYGDCIGHVVPHLPCLQYMDLEAANMGSRAVVACFGRARTLRGLRIEFVPRGYQAYKVSAQELLALRECRELEILDITGADLASIDDAQLAMFAAVVPRLRALRLVHQGRNSAGKVTPWGACHAGESLPWGKTEASRKFLDMLCPDLHFVDLYVEPYWPLRPGWRRTAPREEMLQFPRDKVFAPMEEN